MLIPNASATKKSHGVIAIAIFTIRVYDDDDFNIFLPLNNTSLSEFTL